MLTELLGERGGKKVSKCKIEHLGKAKCFLSSHTFS